MALWTHSPDSGVEVNHVLVLLVYLVLSGEVLRLQTRLGIRWYPPQSLPVPSSYSCICPGLFFFFTEEVFYHLGVWPTLSLMNEEGHSLLAPTLAPVLKRPPFLLPTSEWVNPSYAGLTHMHKVFVGKAGSTLQTYRQSG